MVADIKNNTGFIVNGRVPALMQTNCSEKYN